MKRKFRAWSVEDEMFLDIYSIGFDGNGNIEYVYVFDGDSCSEPPFFKEDESLVLMQYTGFLDVDGVEIYEGDVLDHTSNFGEQSRLMKLIVSWSDMDGSFLFGSIRTDSAVRNSRVIGNIYENPEMA